MPLSCSRDKATCGRSLLPIKEGHDRAADATRPAGTQVFVQPWGRAGGVLAWLLLGLMPLGYDVFGVLPFHRGLDEPMPDAVVITLGYAALSVLVFQAAVRPMVKVREDAWTLTVVGPVFTTEIPLDVVDAIRLQPGPLIVAAGGKDIPANCLMYPHIPVPHFWSRYHRRLKDHVSRLKESRPAASRASIADLRRRLTGPHPALLTLLGIDLAYVAYGFWATHI